MQIHPRLAICLFSLALAHESPAEELAFERIPITPRSRIDALAYLGDGVVIAGTREPHPGHIHKSKDFGASWRRVGNITGPDYITCLCAGRRGTGFLLTGNQVHVWRTSDYGETWEDLGRICHASGRGHANAYGMIMTRQGTLLVADADSQGGHIHRSTDNGATWQDVGRISTHALYRLMEVGDGVIANGWAGHIYKSSDDGATWLDMGRLIDSHLYAIEYIGNKTALIGTKSGHIFASHDNGTSWKNFGVIGASADDFVWLGGRRVLYSTYTGDQHLYLSEDAGRSWTRLGGVSTGIANDWLDHAIYIDDGRVRAVVGGTNKGFILRLQLPGE